ncbi:hypothetical protein [Cysteiniphilum marinum]|uniref:hypothetical protein n=1 Tax=Cysteiniphilum marinum TaxID=2774191 RepID=UPI00193B07DA|nr:hypothetical protein [Cysteiniphilum marinum]
MRHFYLSIIATALSVACISQLNAWGCDGDVPWDPCGILTSDDVPDNEQSAGQFLTTVPDTMKSIHQSPITINKIEQIGLLGDYTETSRNGAALEFLMWQAGYIEAKPHKPQDITKRYQKEEFYNGIYGQNFRFFLRPFDYQHGWKHCQALKYAPSPTQITQAQIVIDGFNTFINEITRPYEPKSYQEETAQEMVDRQTAYNQQTMKAIEAFDYDASMSYARAQLNSYLQTQLKSIDTVNTFYLNQDCLNDEVGNLFVYQ